MNEPFANPMAHRGPGKAEAASAAGLRPALLAAYRDLSSLRYDFPVVLTDGRGSDGFVRSLSGVVDQLLQEIAPPGAAGERLRQHVLQLELRIRGQVARGARGSLGDLWDLAVRDGLPAREDESAELWRVDLAQARQALCVDGPVVDCTDEAAFEILKHVWSIVHARRVKASLEELGELETRLSGILEIDFLNSDDGRSPERLQRSMPGRWEEAIDFDAWSRVLAESSRRSPLPERRKRRISEALSVLSSQRFLASTADGGEGRPPCHSFVFESCERALSAFRERLPEMVELVKAITIAKLEIENRYREERHDDFFSRFDERSLVPEDLARFPSYLICLRAKDCTARERAAIFELLASDLPMKVGVQGDDILKESIHVEGPHAVGAGSVHLASMAVALGNPYVLQAASSSLYQMSGRILEGLSRSGPSLFSIFCASGEKLPHLPPYLGAAAATQSRAFPTFRYDPTAGGSWASRLDLADNPQPEADWPLDDFAYEDEALQRISEEVAFTFVDLAATDPRHADHVQQIAASEWSDDMIPVSKYLDLGEEEAHGRVPYVLAVDGDDVLHRVVVDGVLIQAARRCLDRWRALQQLAGTGRSATLPASAEEGEGKEAGVEAGPEPPLGDASEEGPVDVGAAHAVEETEARRDAGEPYIETPRCTTCDECTQINPRMFAYDDNRQAYIADPDAGTYRELVEAAESCQVSIIHPGEPRNPREPGLPELIGRAEPFR